MKSLLIVEDEKMIRRGIATMAARSSAKIDEIIECRNGVEALEILKEKEIDVVFTDIRMPKMDGIQLVKEISALKQKPDVVVISGYDDFNYAVEMLKQGVNDYILKPVKREKIEEILLKLDAHRSDLMQDKKDKYELLYDYIKHLLFSDQENMEFTSSRKTFQELFGGNAFLVSVLPESREKLEEEQGVLWFQDPEGQSVILTEEERMEHLIMEKHLDYVGISRPYTRMEDGRTAYQEAKKARIHAYVCCKERAVYNVQEEGKAEYPVQENNDFAEKFPAAFVTKDRDRAVRVLFHLMFEGRHGKEEPEQVVGVIRQVIRNMKKTYFNILPEEKRKILDEMQPMKEKNIEKLEEKLDEWFAKWKNFLEEQFELDQNKRKIRQAVQYIQEHYSQDLNMAIVSNYVSMNYSLFSLSFKECTGINFVNYLKNTRIQKAKELLETTDWKVQEIAAKVGYENEKNFMKIFKNTCGISPTEYRRNFDLLSSGKNSEK